MLNEFINQNYLIIENNVVTNVCVWDGNTATWTPPTGSITLVQANIPAMVWVLDFEIKPIDYVLVEQMGVGDIGFTWDGSILTTNQPKPVVPTPDANQPTTTGTVTI